eukprot:CAMPEP_0174260604 /NCGR_PEP_ID=MMETSP0439-20130205/10055_1 /TAXON_ID=0 /ORGANISM="Stereomyxa ramosa, Strain Chinc5" /LENGTH=199 /DNA_ID=CAMNT_0015344879 /DNA_START=47 /DNA_END=646 /DNA_ORIENTATION=+
MRQEIVAAVNFVLQKIVGVPSELLDAFKETLTNKLEERYNGHWYVEAPHKGQAFRCVVCEDEVDELLVDVSKQSGIPDLEKKLDLGWTLWVDPGEVDVRYKHSRNCKAIYRGANPTTSTSPGAPSASHVNDPSPGTLRNLFNNTIVHKKNPHLRSPYSWNPNTVNILPNNSVHFLRPDSRAYTPLKHRAQPPSGRLAMI